MNEKLCPNHLLMVKLRRCKTATRGPGGKEGREQKRIYPLVIGLHREKYVRLLLFKNEVYILICTL